MMHINSFIESNVQPTDLFGHRSSLSGRLIKLLLISWSVVMVGRVLPIVASWPSLALETWLVLIIGFGLIIVSVVLGAASVRADSRAVSISFKGKDRAIEILALASATGAILIAIEFIFLRGYGLGTPVADIRVTEVNNSIDGISGGYGLSGIGRLLTPALPVAWVLALTAWMSLKISVKRMLGFVTVLVIAQQALFEGGRFAIVTLIGVSLITLWWKPREIREKHKKKVSAFAVKIGVSVFLMLGYFLYVFADRAASAGNLYEDAWNIYLTSFFVESNTDYFTNMDGLLGAIKFGLAMLWMYLTQGPNELEMLLNTPDLHIAYGQTQFFQVGILLQRIGMLDVVFNTFDELPNPGTYTTLLGAAFIDFGLVVGLMYVGAVGFFAGWCTKKMSEYKISGASLSAPFMAMLVVFSPVVSIANTVWPSVAWCYIAAYVLSKNRLGCTSKLNTRVKQT